MRVNVYAEEMTNRIEIISKVIDGKTFTGLRFYLELPASFVKDGSCPMGKPATPQDEKQADHYQAPFIHHPGDDDSAAVTFWGKRDLRDVLVQAIGQLNAHYGDTDIKFPMLRKCDEKAKNHPHFTLLAKDNFTANLVEQWIQNAEENGTPQPKINEAREILKEILEWRYANPGLCKIPD